MSYFSLTIPERLDLNLDDLIRSILPVDANKLDLTASLLTTLQSNTYS